MKKDADWFAAACNVVDSVAFPLAHAYRDAAAYSAVAASLVVPSFLRAAGPLSPCAFVVPVFASEVAYEVDLAPIGAENALHGEHHNPDHRASH